MAALKEESALFKELSEMYDVKGEQHISEAFFSKCIDTALSYSKRELRFALFKLRLLNEDVDTGVEGLNALMNSLQKVLDTITGKNIKKAFIITVLETALEEKE